MGREWRYVVVSERVVAGSGYQAEGRSATPESPAGEPWTFASHIAAQLKPPEAVYVMDICESKGQLRLLELNPFSGADLYACDTDAIVRAIGELAAED